MGPAASMRPRRMAAEISISSARTPRSGPRFNEAAANGRGNPPPAARPSSASASGFNEAAANGRGNPASTSTSSSATSAPLQ